MTTQEAIDQLKYLSRLTKKEDAIYFSNRDAEAIDTVVKKLEKPTYTAEDIHSFYIWANANGFYYGELTGVWYNDETEDEVYTIEEVLTKWEEETK